MNVYSLAGHRMARVAVQLERAHRAACEGEVERARECAERARSVLGDVAVWGRHLPAAQRALLIRVCSEMAAFLDEPSVASGLWSLGPAADGAKWLAAQLRGRRRADGAARTSAG